MVPVVRTRFSITALHGISIALSATGLGIVLSVTPRDVWEHAMRMVMVILWSVLIAYKVWSWVRDVSTVIDEQAISQITLHGRVRIVWCEVTALAVRRFRGTAVVTDGETTLVVHPILFADWAAALRGIDHCVPKKAVRAIHSF